VSSRGQHRVAVAGLVWAVRSVWLTLVPALLAGVTFRYLVPEPREADGALARGLATFAERYPALLLAALFVYFAVIVRF
jgi:hypothetical protein